MTTPPAAPRVLIADDDADLRFLTRLVVELADEPLTLVGEAADGDEAVARWRSDRPDVVVLDNEMPGRNGLDAAAEILDEAPGQHVILLSATIDAAVERAARRIGISACLAKVDIVDLPDVIHACAPA